MILQPGGRALQRDRDAGEGELFREPVGEAQQGIDEMRAGQAQHRELWISPVWRRHRFLDDGEGEDAVRHAAPVRSAKTPQGLAPSCEC